MCCPTLAAFFLFATGENLKEGFTPLPNSLLYNENLSLEEKMVMWALMSFDLPGHTTKENLHGNF